MVNSCIVVPPLQVSINPNPQLGNNGLTTEAQIYNLLLGSPVQDDGTVDLSLLLSNPLLPQISEAQNSCQDVINATCVQSSSGVITGGTASSGCPWTLGNPLPLFSTGSQADSITSLINDALNSLQDLTCQTNNQITQIPSIVGASQGAYQTITNLGGTPMDQCSMTDAVLALLTGGLGTALLSGLISSLTGLTNAINGITGNILSIMGDVTNIISQINNAIAQSELNLANLYNAISKGSAASSLASLLSNPCGWAIMNVLAAPNLRAALPPQPVYNAPVGT